MKYIKFQNEIESTVPTIGGQELAVGPGPISGRLSFKPFVDEILCSADMGYFEVQFSFKTRRGECYCYESILPPKRLWIDETNIASSREDNFPAPDVSIRTVLDFRSDYCITMDNGDRVRGFFKYTDAKFDLAIGASEVMVRNSFYYGNVALPPSLVTHNGFVTIFYRLPFSYFLWRRAPKFLSDDFAPESEAFVRVVRFDHPLECDPSSVDVH